MNRLIEAIKKDKVWSGYIINASEISKALELAKQMADELKTVPYIIEEPNMDNIRDLISNLYSDIQNSDYKLAIIYSNNLSVTCQNALLKTVEEPFGNISIIFISTNISVFLPTIISRCVVYNCKKDREEDILKVIGKENLLYARYSFNSLEKAKELLNDNTFIVNRNKSIDILNMFLNKRTVYLNKDEKDNIIDYIFFIKMFLRDVMNDTRYWFFDQKSLIDKYKNTFTFKQIVSMIKIVSKKEMEILKNTNNMLVFDSLQLGIMEVIK